MQQHIQAQDTVIPPVQVAVAGSAIEDVHKIAQQLVARHAYVHAMVVAMVLAMVDVVGYLIKFLINHEIKYE